MGAGREKKEMKEMFNTPSSVKLGQHKTFVKTFMDRGYEIESEERDEELAHDGEVISESHITVLRPENIDMPKLKFVAKEVFGRVDYDTESFQEYEEPHFEVKTYQKSAHIRSANDPWQSLDLD